MAPVCTNCNGTDFVWANDLKTGTMGAGLSLRTRGEIPLGARICRTCGHAELFLRDLTVLHQPHTWRPGEFVPIVTKPIAKAPEHHHSAAAPSAPTHAPAPVAAAPPPPPPPSPPAPLPVPAPPAAAPPPPAPEPEPEPAPLTPMPAEEPESAPLALSTESEPAPVKAKPAKKKTSRTKG